METAKRVRVQNDEENEDQEYEPLSQQLQKNFQLRATEKVPDRPRKLTKPQAPNLLVQERMALKDTLDSVACELEVPVFKPRPINPHLFEHASKLPFVERKSATNFSQF